MADITVVCGACSRPGSMYAGRNQLVAQRDPVQAADLHRAATLTAPEMAGTAGTNIILY